MSRTTAALLAGASLFAAALAPAHAALITLGDSTVDAGSAQVAAGQVGAPDPTPAELGYFQGRFSNGPNAADYVSQALGGGLTLSYLAGGDNFAFGGAAIVTDVNQGTPGLPVGIPDLTDQVDTLLSRGAIGADDDLYVGFGGNDFLAAARGVVDADAVGMEALGVLTEQLRRLAEAGATNVAVSNVNASGFALGGNAGLAASVERYNAALAEALVQLSAETGTRFALADRDGVFDAIIADPLAFGFDPALLGQACLSDPAAVPACDGYVLFDPIHVTTRTQALVADEVLRALSGDAVPLPGALALFAGGLAGLGVVRRKGAQAA